jgi:hypothetical protein
VFRVMNVNGELFGRMATNQPVECIALRSDAVSPTATEPAEPPHILPSVSRYS